MDDAKGSEEGAGKHYEIWSDVKYMLRYKERRQRTNGTQSVLKADRTQLLGILANSAFDYNTVETVLLFCSIIVTLGGIMFESGQFDSATYQETRDAVTVILMIVIVLSIIYFFVVLLVEARMIMTEDVRKKRLAQQKSLRSAKSATASDLDLSDLQMEHSLFMASSGGKGEKDQEMATMEMDAILALEDMDSHTWTMVKDKLRAQQMLFKEFNDKTRESFMDASRDRSSSIASSSTASASTTSNPLLVAAAASRSGRAFLPTRASGAGERKGRGSRRTSRRGLLRPSTSPKPSSSSSATPPPPPPSS